MILRKNSFTQLEDIPPTVSHYDWLREEGMIEVGPIRVLPSNSLMLWRDIDSGSTDMALPVVSLFTEGRPWAISTILNSWYGTDHQQSKLDPGQKQGHYRQLHFSWRNHRWWEGVWFSTGRGSLGGSKIFSGEGSTWSMWTLWVHSLSVSSCSFL